MTPLERSRSLGPKWGLEHLWLKNESVNLSGSFKDRGAVVAIREALGQGYERIMTASSGNAGAAVAAHAARAGLDAVVLVDPSAPAAKLRQIRAYGAEIQTIPGLFDRPAGSFVQLLHDEARRQHAYLAFFWEPVNSAIIQGFEVIAEETVAQLGQAPDVVVVPTGGGDHLVAEARAYLRLWRQGKTRRVPRLIAVQASGACPLVEALDGGMNAVPFRPGPSTMASGLRVAFSGDHALDVIRRSEGCLEPHTAVTVSDEDIRHAQTLLGTMEGLWIEPSGTAGVAALPRLLAEGLIQPSSTVVAPLTGGGWKDTDEHLEG